MEIQNTIKSIFSDYSVNLSSSSFLSKLISQSFGTKDIQTKIIYFCLYLLAAVLLYWLLSKLFSKLYHFIKQSRTKYIRPLKVRGQEILSEEYIAFLLIATARGLEFIIKLIILYSLLSNAFSLFLLPKYVKVFHLVEGIFQAVITTALIIPLFHFLNSIYNNIRKKVIKLKGTFIKCIRIMGVDLLSESNVTDLVLFSAAATRFFTILILGYFYISLLFGYFPFTQAWSQILLSYILVSFTSIFLAIAGFIPNIFYILAISYVSYYMIKLVRIVFREVEKGNIALPGFYVEWAIPTYKIVRFVILIFAFIIIFPYLPGSDSPGFKGISVFLGLLFSLGSTASIANVVAGVVMTYMRPFKIGDRVRIAETTGDIIDKTLLVTRIRTVKNVDITIPNSMILSSHIVNYSSSAQEKGLILHTSISISYNVPWTKVHELLFFAAKQTENIMETPEPFVLQKKLDDFYVHYELNAYTQKPEMMERTYSALHQNIQNKFYESRIEIMSPHFSALRDGNRIELPDNYLPKDYNSPSFKISNFSGLPSQKGNKPQNTEG